MHDKPLVLVTNLKRLELVAEQGRPREVRPIDEPATLRGAWRLLRSHRDAHAILIDDDDALLMKLCLARFIWPRWLFGGPRLCSIDLILNKPAGWRERLKARVKRVLLSRVDHFVHYFRDLSEYQRYFGISAKRSTYVPFKVNAWERIKRRAPAPDGEYVFSSGRSMRDFETFAQSLQATGLPGLLTFHRRELNVENGTPFPLRAAPGNLRIVEDDGTLERWIEDIAGARVVVIATLPDAIRAVGISLAMMALGLGKAVVMTEGVTTRGMFQEEILTVPPGNSAALAQAIGRLWKDDALRQELSRRGRQFAERLGGETELFERIYDALRAHLMGKQSQTATQPPASYR